MVGYHVETGLQLQETFVITPSLAYSPVMENVMRIAKHVMAVVLKDSNHVPLATLTETMSKSATMTLMRVAIIFIMDFVGARIKMLCSRRIRKTHLCSINISLFDVDS